MNLALMNLPWLRHPDLTIEWELWGRPWRWLGVAGELAGGSGLAMGGTGIGEHLAGLGGCNATCNT